MSETGRYYVKTRDGRTFCVEPVDDNHREKWGDVCPSTGKIMGDYGSKGAVKPEESVITEENGFKNIIVLSPGVSPDNYIKAACKKGQSGR